MSGPVFGVRHMLPLPLPPVRRDEVLRYAGVQGNPGSEIIGLMEACIRESESIRTAHFLYVPVPVSQGTVEFQGQKYSGKTLERTLKDSRAALVFAATLGFDMDQLIRRYARTAQTSCPDCRKTPFPARDVLPATVICRWTCSGICLLFWAVTVTSDSRSPLPF